MNTGDQEHLHAAPVCMELTPTYQVPLKSSYSHIQTQLQIRKAKDMYPWIHLKRHINVVLINIQPECLN